MRLRCGIRSDDTYGISAASTFIPLPAESNSIGLWEREGTGRESERSGATRGVAKN